MFAVRGSHERSDMRDRCSRVSLRSYYKLEQLEIFLLLPVAHFGLIAGDLGLLDAQIVIDEILAEAGRKEVVRAQRRERLFKSFWKKLRRRLVGRVGRRSGVELARDAVAPGGDLRGHI